MFPTECWLICICYLNVVDDLVMDFGWLSMIVYDVCMFLMIWKWFLRLIVYDVGMIWECIFILFGTCHASPSVIGKHIDMKTKKLWIPQNDLLVSRWFTNKCANIFSFFPEPVPGHRACANFWARGSCPGSGNPKQTRNNK